MAPKVTSSRDRGKGKARKPVTTSKGRANRQGAASGRPITQRGRQERGGARVTQGRGAAPTQAPALPPGKKGGPLARRTPGGQPRLPGGTGNQPRLPGGTGGQLRLPPGSAKVLGRGGGLLGPIGAAFALGTQIGEMMEPSRGQQAINRRISQDAAREAEEKANPTRGGLTGDQRLRNARADRNRRIERDSRAKAGSSPARARVPSTELQAPEAGNSGGSARVPQAGSGRASNAGSTSARVPQGQSQNMDENYATWTRANRKLAEKVKPGQAGYAAIQRELAKIKGPAAQSENQDFQPNAPKLGQFDASPSAGPNAFTGDDKGYQTQQSQQAKKRKRLLGLF